MFPAPALVKDPARRKDSSGERAIASPISPKTLAQRILELVLLILTRSPYFIDK